MKNVRCVLGLLVLMSLLALGSSYGQAIAPAGGLPPGTSPRVKVQIERLHSFDPVERRNAARALGGMGEEAVQAIPVLIRALNDSARLAIRSPEGEGPASSVAEAAMLALVNIGAAAVGPLVASLQDNNPGVRMMAVTALGRIEDPGTVEPLIEVLKSDSDSLVQAAAVDALRRKQDSRALAALVLAEQNRSWVVRSLAKSAVEEARAGGREEVSSPSGESGPAQEGPEEEEAGEDLIPWGGGTASLEEQAPEGSAGEMTHTVQRGETLYSLGRRYGVSWQALMTYNNMHDPTALAVGQELKIPTGAAARTPLAWDGVKTYTVQDGDILYDIGLLFGMSWREIAALNGLTDPDQIFVGQVLKIPGVRQAAPSTREDIRE